MAHVKCTGWKPDARNKRYIVRKCGRYHARIKRGGLHLPWFTVYVYRNGRQVDRGTADTLAKAKHFANPRITGR